MEPIRVPVPVNSVLISLTLISLFLTEISTAFLIKAELHKFNCLEGFAGESKLPAELVANIEECGFDKTQGPECMKHCLARKMGMILEGRIWLYKLAIAIKMLFPTPDGKDSWDKVIDVILECTDRHFKAYGPLTPFHCYREKRMWDCVIKAVDTICTNNHRLKVEAQKNSARMRQKNINDKPAMNHHDLVVDGGDGEAENQEEANENENNEEGQPKADPDTKHSEQTKKDKEIVLRDY